jgi:glycosyltransferase involved in cell wall biosynthesis
MWISFDDNLIVRNVSDVPTSAAGLTSRKTDQKYTWESLLGKRIPRTMILPSDYKAKPVNQLRVAIVCNWDDKCGISTYSNYLVKAMLPKVAAIKVFSETKTDRSIDPETKIEVEDCWERGGNLLPLAERILDWSPDFIIVQHEFGIFPDAFRFMQFIQAVKRVPTITCMHSIYHHLDKLVYTEAIPNIIVHTKQAKNALQEMGNSSRVFVIHHGCVQSAETDEIWNIMRNSYTIMQFGFGFRYKGVDRALQAVANLVHGDPKFKNLYYFYLCSSNSHNHLANQEYCDYLLKLAEELGIRDNVTIVMKYQSDKMLNLYLRLAKLVVFPYLINDDNMVYGSSGAVRLAMAAKRPVIASESHLFDDLEGVIPRPQNAEELSKAIDSVFSNAEYRSQIIDRAQKYIAYNTWDIAADRYLAIYNELIDG